MSYIIHKSSNQNRTSHLIPPILFLLSPFSNLISLLWKVLSLTSYLLPHKLRKRLNATQRLFLNVIIGSVILVFGTWIVTSLLNPEQTKAAWFDSSWLYRKTVAVTNSGIALQSSQIPIVVDTASLISDGKMRSDCRDIRVTSSTGKVLKQWIHGCNTSSTVVYAWALNVPNGNSNFYVYYGNRSASTLTDIKTGTSQYPGISCKTILDHGDSTGNGTYTIDPNAGSPTDSFSATCDMTTDNGGWTIINSSNGTTNQQGLASNTEVSGDPFNNESSNISLLKKQDIATLSAESLIKRSNGKWLKVSVPFFDGNLTTPNQHPHNTNVTLTADDGTTTSTAVTGYSNYNNSSGGDYGITTSVGFDHHNATYYHLRSGCGSHYFYKYGTTYNVNVALGSWTQSVACTSNSTALGPWYGGLRGTNPPVPAYLTISSPTSEEYSPAPVAYWSMDEGTGSIVHDKTSIGSNGTISGATWEPASRCKVGKCLYFDGTNDSVDFGNISPRASISGNLTVSFWIKPTNIAKGRQNPIGKAYGGEFDMTMETNGSLNMYHGSAGNDAAPYTQITSPTLSQNQWTHVVYVRDTNARTFKIYFNGKQVKSQTYTSTYDPVASTRSFKFGYEYAGYYQGYLDEVMLFPTAKTQQEINALYSAGSAGVASVKGVAVSAGTDDKSTLNQGLVGLWKMDEASWNGTTGEVIDSSGTGNNGTSVNGADASTSAKFGNSGGFDGVNDYVSIPDNSSINPSSGITLSTWIKGDSWSANNNILSKPITSAWNSPYGTYDLEIQNNGTKIDFLLDIGGSPKQQFSTVSLSTGTWYHIVTTYDGKEQKTYLNGVLITTTAQTGAIATSTQPLAIGTRSTTTASQYFNGNIDETRIYNRALTSAEVTQLYNYAPGPTAYYPFEESNGATTIADKSSHNLNLTTSGSPTFVTGKYGKAVKFDNNTTDGASLSNALYQLNNYTYGFWFRLDTAHDGSYRQIFSLYGNSDRQPGLWRKDDTDCFHSVQDPSNKGFSCMGPTGTSTSWETGKWYYYSQAKNGTTVTAYVNGIQVATTTVTDPMTTSTTPTMYLGKSAGYNAAGITLDEFRLYNYARTSGQIIEDMNASHPLGGSPVGSQALYYKFDEGYGTVAHDSAPNPAHGTLTCGGAGCILPEWKQDGKFGKALYFNAADTANNPTVTITSSTYTKVRTLGDVTITAWINPSSSYLDTSQAILREGQGADQEYSLYYNATSKTISFSWYDGAFKGVSAPNNLVPMNKWSYVAAVRSGTTVYFYVNGKQVGSAAVTAPTVNAAQLSIGRTNNTGVPQDYSGYIDELKVYTAALSSDTIKLDYNRGASLLLGTLGTSSDGTASSSASTAYCVPGDTSSCAAPVAEWNFEEHKGTTVNDISGNGNTGTLTNNPTWTQGKHGEGLNFLASSSYVSTSGISVGSTWTVSLWTKFPLASNGSYRTLIRNGSNIHHILVDSSGLLGTYNSSFASSGYDVDVLSGWHHLTAVGTGGSTLFYIDGSYVGTSSQQTTSTITQLGGIGSGQNWGAPIDDFRVYNYVRTPSQVAYDYNRGAAVAHWKMDECQGSVIHDASGNGLNGTITVGGSGTQTSIGTCATSSTSWGNGATGKFNSSINFDGTDDYINMGQPSTLQITSSMTLSAWVKTTDTGLGGFIGKWYNTPGNRGYRFLTNNGDIELHISSDGTADSFCSVNPGINDGTWQFVAAVYNASTGGMQLYNNGKLVKSCTGLPTSIYNNSINFNLGTSDAGTTGSNTLAGQMDDVQVFNYALNQTQIRNLMNQNSSIRYGPAVGTP